MTDAAPPLLATLRAVAEMLGEHDVDWAVLGGVAANVYRGAARMTFDVDLLVTVDHSSMAAIAESAEMEGWHIRYLHPDGRMVRLSHDEMAFADLIAVETEYQRAALERAQHETFADGLTARVLAVEDVIVHKLVANRPRDVADIADILEARAPMDVDYLEHWMQVWGVADRLAAICQQHALPPPERLAQERRPPHLEATTADHRGTMGPAFASPPCMDA